MSYSCSIVYLKVLTKMATSNQSDESVVFRKLYAKLRDGIQADLNTLAMELYSVVMINPEVRDKATQVFVAAESRASTLLSAIEKRIKINPREFWKFVEILEDYQRDLAAELKEECEKFKKKSEQCDGDADLPVPARRFDVSSSYPCSTDLPNGRALRGQFGPQQDTNGNEGLTEQVPLRETGSVFYDGSVGVGVKPLPAQLGESESDEELRRVNRFTIAVREVKADCDKGLTKMEQEYDGMREYYKGQLQSTEQVCKSLERELELSKSAHQKETGDLREDMLYMVRQCRQQDQVLRQKDSELLEQDRSLREKDSELLEQDRSLREKDSELLERDRSLREKDSELLERDRSLREKDSELLEMKQKLMEKDDHLHEVEAELEGTKAQLKQKTMELQEKKQENDLLQCKLKQQEIKQKLYMCKRIHELVDRMSKESNAQELQEIRERIDKKVSKLRTSVGGHRKSLSCNM